MPEKTVFKPYNFGEQDDGLGKEQLGDSLETVSKALKAAELTAVMELNIHIYDNGLTAEGQSPLEILQANLPAITTLPCPLVHWHLVSFGTLEEGVIGRLENALLPQFTEAVTLARHFGFHLGFEHNAPDLMLFADPENCLNILRQVPALGFVWDFNHVVPEKLSAFQAMIPWMSMLHVSDTPLPEVNHHLPLGKGTVDLEENFRALRKGRFSGPRNIGNWWITQVGGVQSGYRRGAHRLPSPP